MHDVSGYEFDPTYLNQVARSNVHSTAPFFEQVEVMYNEGTPPEFVIDQGMYYPAATNYGYYCTGFESPGEWEDHHRIFGVDGPEIQYAGMQTESLPYVYYTPSYGYAQSPYNPYNPYIPGAMVGVDGPIIGSQQYYSIPPYQNPSSSPGYFPFIVQPDIVPNSSSEPWIETGALVDNKPDGRGLKHNAATASVSFHKNSPKQAPNQANSLTKVSEVPRVSVVGSTKQQMTGGSFSSSSVSPHVHQGRTLTSSIQAVENVSSGRVVTHRNSLEVPFPATNGVSELGSSAHGQFIMDKFRSKVNFSRTLTDVSGSPNALGEQNRGPRMNRSKNQLIVKAYTTKAGNCNADGNIIICTDQYNKDDFPLDYTCAKFFVIKSYSEDDVHKSIKYNVWSSTPNGNKKLDCAYHDAQKIAPGNPRGCPIFLFFSVNASGQFCGVAEMIGPVDFQKDMDFWQQDKWSGSFPVKWHIIKDVPNANFRHIILENNENKPVTNSRDTQEIMFNRGLQMLKIFKNHPMKTSILDDFVYYENRQKVLQEEKEKLHVRSFGSPFVVPAEEPLRRVDDRTLSRNEDNSKRKDLRSPEAMDASAAKQAASNEHADKIPLETKNDDISSTLRIGSLAINPKQSNTSAAADSEPLDIVTVGSVPVKVNCLSQSSRRLTVGSIPLDPRALQLDKGGAPAK